MSGLGYVIRSQHIHAAIERAISVEVPHLERCLELVMDLDALERSLPDRIHKARTETGIEMPALSKAANEAISQSADAGREIDRLLTRKCNRATSSQAVIKEILPIAKADMQTANFLDNEVPDDDPTKAIHSEMYWKKRELVASLREFLAETGM